MIPTVGFNMRKITKGNVTIKVYKILYFTQTKHIQSLQLWDIGGQPRFRSMWERYCRGVNAIVFMVIMRGNHHLFYSKSSGRRRWQWEAGSRQKWVDATFGQTPIGGHPSPRARQQKGFTRRNGWRQADRAHESHVHPKPRDLLLFNLLQGEVKHRYYKTFTKQNKNHLSDITLQWLIQHSKTAR